MSKAFGRVWLPVLALAMNAPMALGGEPSAPSIYDNVQKTDCRAWAKRFDPFRLEWRVPGGSDTLRCVTRVDDGGRGRKGAKVTLTATATDASGRAVSLGTRAARTDQSGGATIEFPVSGVAAGGEFTATVEGRYSSWKKATTISTECAPSGR